MNCFDIIFNMSPPLQLRSPSSRQRVVINIGGQRFVTYDSTLNMIPTSRLARLTPCDPAYEPEDQEYFFDRYHDNSFSKSLRPSDAIYLP